MVLASVNQLLNQMMRFFYAWQGVKTGTAIAQLCRDQPRYKTSEPHCELATYAVMPYLSVFDALGVIQNRLALWF